MVRYKNRYITIEIWSKNKVDTLNLKTIAIHDAIQNKVSQMYGDLGSAAVKAGFTAKYCNTRTKIALLKIRHKPHMFLLKAIPKINDLAGKLVTINILYIGATMKQCFIFIKKFQRNKLEYMWQKMKNDNERKNLEEELMTMTPDMKDFM